MAAVAQRCAAALAICSLLSCQSGPVPHFLAEPADAASAPRWPAPPAEPRIVHLAEIDGERDFVPRRSLLRRIAGRIIGESFERLVRPAALAVRGDLLAVADPGRSGVHLLDLSLRTWRTVTRCGERPLLSPVGVALLADGRLLVSDSATDSVWWYDRAGECGGAFSTARLRRPTGLAFDASSGRIWVAETLAHRLRAFDAQGRELVRVGRRGRAVGEFNYPVRVAADAQGGIWVTDALNFRVQHIDAAGHATASFGRPGDRAGAFARPGGLAVDARGRLLVVDALFDAVQIFDPGGRLLLTFGGRGIAPGEFWLPADVALDRAGRVYVADSYNQRVQIFSYRPPDGP